MRLTARMQGLEPGPAIDSPLRLSPDQRRTIYYFTELRGMNGRKLVHQWEWNGRVVQRKELTPGSSAWRTYSGITITGDRTGRWRVALLDASTGRLISDARFEVQ